MDPKRLIDEGTSSLGAQCLRAGKSDRPSRDARSRTLAAVGLLSASATAAGTSGISTLAKSLLAAFVVGGGIVAFAVIGGESRHVPRVGRPAASVRHVQPVRPARQAVAAPEATIAPPATSASVRTPPQSGSKRSAASGAGMASHSTLAEETALLDAARQSLRAQRPDEALATVNRYQRTFWSGVLAPEAAALRVQILQRMGRHAQAGQEADAFLREHPESPLADRVQQARASRQNPSSAPTATARPAASGP
jgi:hypothetical protein